MRLTSSWSDVTTSTSFALTSSLRTSNSSANARPFTAGGTATCSFATGWRTGSCLVSRAARASDASLRIAAMAASSSGSRRPWSDGNEARCTEVPVSARCSQSDTKGAAGAISCAVVSSTSYRVRRAASSAARSGAQNRGRLVRTYQLERSSATKSMIARVPAVTS